MFAILTGLVAGIVHVWSGPDHLAAIAPLAVRRNRPPSEKAWLPGFRWGMGHSAGVAVVGVLSLWLRDLLPLQRLTDWGERFVGLMLLAIGFWAFRKAYKVHAHEHEHDGSRHLHMHAHHHRESHDKPQAHAYHTHAAFGIGTLHGLAGSSHLFGVLPILAFPTHAQALGYLLAFGAGTVVSMASFSWCMSWLTQRCASNSTTIYRGLMTTCACVALFVGCYWLFP